MTINFYENLASPAVLENITIEDWFDLIKGSQLTQVIKSARAGEINYDDAKANMPCVTYNFLFNKYKSNDNILSSTGLMYIDIDHADFTIDLVDKSKVYAYYKSFGGNGYAIIVKVAGLDLDNFKASYIKVLAELGVTKFVDPNAIKATQFNALSYDENIFVNNECHIFNAETVTPSIVIKKEEKTYTIDGVTKVRSQIRFNNLDDIQINDSHVVNWEGYDYINCWIPMQKRPNQHRNNFMLSYANNLVWLNPDLSIDKATDILMSVNEVALLEPYTYKKVRGIIESMFRYKAAGTLKPIYNHKKRKIVFKKGINMSRTEKLEIVRQELAIMRTDKSISKLIGIVNDWDFEAHGTISVRSISKNHPISFKTVAKYYPQFRDTIAAMNFEYKKYKQVNTRIEEGATEIIDGVTDLAEQVAEPTVLDVMVETEAIQNPDETGNVIECQGEISEVQFGDDLQPLDYFVRHYGAELGRELYEGQMEAA